VTLPNLGQDDRVQLLRFGPPGSDEIIVGAGQQTFVWRYTSAEGQTRRIPLGAGALSPDGRVAVSIGKYVGSGPGGYSPVTFWDYRQQLPLATKSSPQGMLITVAAFSKDGRALICGTNGGEIIVWSVPTGALSEIVGFNHRAGSFRKNGDVWTEFDESGRATFTFKEVSRDSAFILLKDESRGLWLRLPTGGGQSFWASSSGGPWNALHDLTVVKRTGGGVR
jgi:WD40 repeat protein